MVKADPQLSIAAIRPRKKYGRDKTSTNAPKFCRPRAGNDGKTVNCQTRLMATSGVNAQKTARQPKISPSHAPSGAAKAEAMACPPYMIDNARGTSYDGTSRIITAVASAQNPPMQIPRMARAVIRAAKLGAMATMTSDISISIVNPTNTDLRLTRPATVVIIRLATRAKSPLIEIA